MAGEIQPGSLTVIGTGITAVAHVTLEAAGHIREADVVLHNLHGIAAAHVAALNPRCVALAALYGEGKQRAETYVQMAELILREVRAGRRVVAVFHGHPGVLNNPAHRALAVAEAEGATTVLLPGISTVDALLADLRIHVGPRGCQIVEANAVLLQHTTLLTDGHLIVLQPGVVGHATGPSEDGHWRGRTDLLFERLAEVYGASHDCVIYSGAAVPTEGATIIRRSLGDCAGPAGGENLPAQWTLYVPPRDTPDIDSAMAERLGMSRVLAPAGARPAKSAEYGPFEREAVARLDAGVLPEPEVGGGRLDLLLKIMTKVATSPRFAASAPWLARRDPPQ